jgi:hypothetical protein
MTCKPLKINTSHVLATSQAGRADRQSHGSSEEISRQAAKLNGLR